MNIQPYLLRALYLLGLLLAPIQAQKTVVSPLPQKIINYGGGWKDGQVNEPCILVNPKDSSKLIMFYSGMQLGGSRGAIGKAWANINEPFIWHEDAANPLMTADANIPFEASAIRLDTVIYQKARDEYWIYYTGSNFKTQADAIGLAICPAGKDGYSQVTTANLKRYEGNPILSPRGQGREDESYVSQGAVFRERGKWYSLYSYRTSKAVLPGLRLAVSPDGKHWTKQPGADLLAAAPESVYIEWHQIYKIGKRYVMLYEGYNGGTRWGADIAVSDSLTAGWKKAPVTLIDQTQWANYSDETLFHVATPALYQIQGHWYLYFQAAHSGFYIKQHWALWGLEYDDLLKQIASLP
ncbi:MAG TPA: hypothetical protein PLD20_01100 [Blastocatellia bacterium]|nr:hypothetical protein [Blastocatellia bacterium]HMV86606.1 hypothetical protein [Blastocatellia bacterium]HMX29102.1 hypothetical protein [Blastocatellia bacterium]HMZ16533.1 hypothetical protein [Blastocatellia bacterium]HNG33449.1 hypothetical protein [Blastocatellia bacterium]